MGILPAVKTHDPYLHLINLRLSKTLCRCLYMDPRMGIYLQDSMNDLATSSNQWEFGQGRLKKIRKKSGSEIK